MDYARGLNDMVNAIEKNFSLLWMQVLDLHVNEAALIYIMQLEIRGIGWQQKLT